MKNGTNETDFIDFKIPQTIHLVGKRLDQDKYKITLDHIRAQMGNIFNLIEHLGNDMREGEVETQYYAEYLLTLSRIGEGFTEALEITEMEYQQAQEIKPDKIDDFSAISKLLNLGEKRQTNEGEFSELAKHLSIILNDDAAPASLHNAIFDNVFNVPEATKTKIRERGDYSPEFIADCLEIKMMHRAEKAKSEILDMSNHVTAEDDCLDLAKQMSSIIHNAKTPKRVRNAITDSLGEIEQPLDIINSPEYIAKVLCAEAKNEK